MSKFLKNIKKKNLHINHKGGEAETLHTCLGHYNPYINCVFCSGWIRTLVVMASYSFHRLLMGKVKIDIFSCLKWDIWNYFYRNVY